MAVEITRPKPEKPPTGMILIDGQWQVRRHGLLSQRRITCIFGHRIKLGLRPFEVAVPCDHRESAGQAPCNAQLYLFTTRARLIWAMDVTADEAELIARENMDADQIIEHFSAGFPVERSILRKRSA